MSDININAGATQLMTSYPASSDKAVTPGVSESIGDADPTVTNQYIEVASQVASVVANLAQSLEELKNNLEIESGNELKFSKEQGVRATIIQVVDSTGDVVKTIPSDEFIEAARQVESIRGLILDGKI